MPRHPLKRLSFAVDLWPSSRRDGELHDYLTLGAEICCGGDRHWRNLRTRFSHNPTPYMARVIRDNFVNARPLPREGFF
jgi:hypothetical protein